MRYDSIFFYTKNGERPKRHKMNFIDYGKICVGMYVMVDNGGSAFVNFGKEYTNGTINWGDGTSVEVDAVGNYSHTYKGSGNYRVLFRGNTDYLGMTSPNITGFYCLGEDVGIKSSVGFRSKSDTPMFLAWNEKFFNNFDTTNNPFVYIFMYSSFENNPPSYFISKLTNHSNLSRIFSNTIFNGHVPDLLFANCTHSINLWEALAYVTVRNQDTHKTNKLFYNCKGDMIFNNVFSSMGNHSGIKQYFSLGDSTFENCTGKCEMMYCFMYSLITSIGNNTFKGCRQSKFGNCFSNSFVESIGDGTFEDCTDVEDFSSIFIFARALKSLGKDTFKNCINAKKFNDTFNGTNLTHIDENIFQDCVHANEFINCFSGCTSLISAPRLWELYPNANGRGCYRNCTSLPWYDEIPSNWK